MRSIAPFLLRFLDSGPDLTQIANAGFKLYPTVLIVLRLVLLGALGTVP